MHMHFEHPAQAVEVARQLHHYAEQERTRPERERKRLTVTKLPVTHAAHRAEECVFTDIVTLKRGDRYYAFVAPDGAVMWP